MRAGLAAAAVARARRPSCSRNEESPESWRTHSVKASASPEGAEMKPEYWEAGYAKSLMVWLNGKAITALDRWGERVEDDSFCVLFNAHHEALPFTVPAPEWGGRWEVAVDTRWMTFAERPRHHVMPGDEIVVSARGIVVLRSRDRDRS